MCVSRNFDYKTSLLISIPAFLDARDLRQILDPNLQLYMFIDFCSGAGSPTPYIEPEIRLGQLSNSRPDSHNGSSKQTFGQTLGVEVIFADLQPHIHAWSKASKSET